MSLALFNLPLNQPPQALDFLAKTSTFKPKVEFELDLKNFVIKTASTAAELREIINLRQHSFIEEFMGEDGAGYIDFDHYDLMADHIILKSKKTGEIVGSYRILNSSFAGRLFSAEQFDLSLFDRADGIKVELGRAVIHKDHRNGLTLSLVWKGIAHYAMLANARYLCGCASTKTLSQRVAESIYWHLYPSHSNDQFDIKVLPAFEHPNIFDPQDLMPWEFTKEAIPPLLKTYIKAGSKICSRPAYDRVFKCVDFFTVLDLKTMNAQYQEKYFG
ncbi:MAG: GNAT family N-acyltransferase [Bdellovibrionota bacterium]